MSVVLLASIIFLEKFKVFDNWYRTFIYIRESIYIHSLDFDWAMVQKFHKNKVLVIKVQWSSLEQDDSKLCYLIIVSTSNR